MGDNLTKILITCMVLLFIAICIAGACFICSMTFLLSGDFMDAIKQTEMPRLVIPTSLSSGAPVAKATTQPAGAPTEAPATQLYKAGDVIKLKDYTIILNSTEFITSEYNEELLKANFTVENQGTNQLNISGFLEFTARNEDGTKPDLTSLGCGTELSGSILPGDKLRGDICWKAPFSSTIKIYYTPELFGTTAVIWEVKK